MDPAAEAAAERDPEKAVQAERAVEAAAHRVARVDPKDRNRRDTDTLDPVLDLLLRNTSR